MTTSDDLGSYIDKTIKQEASALVVQLDNEYIGITTDSNGNGGNFTDCYTNVTVFSGSTDITKSSDLSWTITATSGVVGEWDKTKYRYTLKGLSTDRGEVVFDLIYMGKIAISKSYVLQNLKLVQLVDKEYKVFREKTVRTVLALIFILNIVQSQILLMIC